MGWFVNSSSHTYCCGLIFRDDNSNINSDGGRMSALIITLIMILVMAFLKVNSILSKQMWEKI